MKIFLFDNIIKNNFGLVFKQKIVNIKIIIEISTL